MDVPLTEATTRYLLALAQAATQAREKYENALRLVCLQAEGAPERFTITPDFAGKTLRITGETDGGEISEERGSPAQE